MQRYIAAACTGRAPGVSIRKGLVTDQRGALCGAHALQAPAEGRLLANPACKGSTVSQATGPITCRQGCRHSQILSHTQGAEHIAHVIPLPEQISLVALLIRQKTLTLSSVAMLLQAS